MALGAWRSLAVVSGTSGSAVHVRKQGDVYIVRAVGIDVLAMPLPQPRAMVHVRVMHISITPWPCLAISHKPPQNPSASLARLKASYKSVGEQDARSPSPATMKPSRMNSRCSACTVVHVVQW